MARTARKNLSSSGTSKEGRAPPRGWDMSNPIIFRTLRLEDVDEAVAAADIDTMPFGIGEDIVSVAADIDLCYARTVADRKGRKLGGAAKGDEHSLGVLIDRHGEIRSGIFYYPARAQLAGEPVHDGDPSTCTAG